MHIVGPITPKSIGGKEYLLTVVDDWSQKAKVKFLKKSDTIDELKELITQMECQAVKKLCRMRSDNGREFISTEMDEYFKEKGTIHEFTTAYTPMSYGVPERMNRTLIEMVRTTLQDSQLAFQMWAEICLAMVHIKNNC